MKAKVLLNLLPIAAVAIVASLSVSSQWQHPQANRSGDDQPMPAPGRSPHAQSDLVTVINVHDGDTITVKQGWRKVRVRLCGIDAPELAQPLGVESRNQLRQFIASAGNQVILYGNDTDRYGRRVAEVFVPDPTPQQPEQEKVLNDEMVRVGMAYHYAKYSDRCPNGRSGLVEAEAEAKRLRKGVWQNPNAVKPWDYRKLNR